MRTTATLMLALVAGVAALASTQESEQPEPPSFTSCEETAVMLIELYSEYPDVMNALDEASRDTKGMLCFIGIVAWNEGLCNCWIQPLLPGCTGWPNPPMIMDCEDCQDWHDQINENCTTQLPEFDCPADP